VSTPPAVEADSPLIARERGTPSPLGEKTKRRTFAQRCEAWLSRLSTRNTFFQRAFSLVYLPFAWRSGISMKRLGESRFVAILPFTRFNRNWYNAMAGASLLGNSEVAGGLYLFARCGGDYMVVCKEIRYRFLRPCFGPAVYEVVRSGDLEERLKHGGEFNIDLEMDIRQQLRKKGKELLVGRCSVTFHCTPKAMAQAKAERRRVRTTTPSA
jgi:acyl-coenzyme A thioesterase PaaI-like protein